MAVIIWMFDSYYKKRSLALAKYYLINTRISKSYHNINGIIREKMKAK
jgi:hypothetical protein